MIKHNIVSVDSPAYAGAPMHGQLVPSQSERALSFDDGTDYTPRRCQAWPPTGAVCRPMGLLRAERRRQNDLPLLCIAARPNGRLRAAETCGTADMTALAIVDDVIELDGRPVARLLPNLRLSLRDRLAEAFDAIDEDAETIARLEYRIAWLESRLAASTPRGGS